VGVVDEVDAVQIDHPQIWSGRLELVNIDDLVDLLLLLLALLIGANQVQHLQSVDEVVDLAHEALHKDHLGETDAHVPELGGKGLHLAEIVQLHG